MTDTAPEITVSIVSYNTRDLLRACLQALRERQAVGEAVLQIIVADNASRDGSLEMVQQEFPEVEAFATGSNLGFGRAHNLCFARARGRYFLVLNSDTEIEPGALLTLRDFMDTHPDAGAAGGQLVWPDGSPQASYGSDPELRGIFYEQTFLGNLMSRLRPAQEPETSMAGTGEPREVEQICGACQFVRSTAYRQVGGYDPAYFMYHEDVDLNMHLRRAGWRVFYVPAARIRHHLGGSSQQDWRTRARMVSALNWSRYYYYHRYEGAWRGRLVKSLFVLGAGLRLGAWTCLALTRPHALEKVKLFREVLRRTWKMTPHHEAP
ncbi:MAG TPA: glycosyltransferase family 2 protein [Abditibacteriaceae bacterium]|nr:glycosyltransferase family 2 protein [Abditibacteriaceae bacterium]